MEGTGERTRRTGETGHVDAVGTADHGDDSMGRGGAGKDGQEQEVGGMHCGWFLQQVYWFVVK